MASLRIAVQSAGSREKTLQTSKKLYETNLKRFQRAIINANELRIDQERLYQAEYNAIKGWAEAHLAYMRACHAVGLEVRNCIR